MPVKLIEQFKFGGGGVFLSFEELPRYFKHQAQG